jgi:hypothetical protein
MPTVMKISKKQKVTVMPATTEIITKNTNENDQFYYAGIGSRKTPDHICTIMNQVARYLESEGWILRSGAAHGADLAFEEGIHDEAKEIYLPWAGYNNHPSGLHPRAYPFSQQEQDFTAHFHPNWRACSPSARLLHQRNTRIILGLEALHGYEVRASRFVVCWTVRGMPTGGTGQALRIAEHYGIPIVNFGLATSANELERLLLDIDDIQGKIRA